MIGFGWALGLGAAACWTGLDSARKALVVELRPITVAVLLMFGQLPFFVAWAVYDGTWVQDDGYWLPAVISMAVNALANVLFMISVQLSPLSRTVPFLSLTPVLSALIAIPLLDEVPGTMQWSGIALVVLGALVLNSDLASSLLAALVKEKGAPYMIAVSGLWATSTAFDKVALPSASPATHAALLTSGSAAILLSWLAVRGDLRSLGDATQAPPLKLIALIGFAVAALGLQMLALQVLWVATVETLKRAIGVIGSIVLGRVLFKEPVTPRKLAALTLMLAGTAVLTLNTAS